MAAQPDPRPAARKVATRDEWDVLRAKKLGPCRVCRDTYQIELHHLVPRSLGGDDVADNLIPLCHLCHTRYESREDKLVAHYIRHTLSTDELYYVLLRKGEGFLSRYYPRLSGDAPPSSQGGIAGEDTPEGAIGTTLSAHPAGRDPESSPLHVWDDEAGAHVPIRPRYRDPDEDGCLSGRKGRPAKPVRGPSAPSVGSNPTPSADDEPCSVCRGTGRRKKRTTGKRAQRFTIAVPVAEPDGKATLQALVEQTGEKLAAAGLSYTSSTPAFYVVTAGLYGFITGKEH